MSAYKFVTYEDPEGRKWRRQVPQDAEEWEAVRGIPAGPPDVRELDLPYAIGIRLHNELFNRGLWDMHELRRRRPELDAALRAALRLDTQRLEQLYSPADVEAL